MSKRMEKDGLAVAPVMIELREWNTHIPQDGTVDKHTSPETKNVAWSRHPASSSRGALAGWL